MSTPGHDAHPLTGRALPRSDLGSLVPGQQLVVMLDGWTQERLTLSLTEVRGTLTHRADRWVYGIDSHRRLRLVLLRPAGEEPAR